MPRDLLDRSVSSVGRKVFPATRVRVFANRVTGITYGIEPIGTHIDPWPVYGGSQSRWTQSSRMVGCMISRSESFWMHSAVSNAQRAASKTPLRSMSNLKRAVRRSDRADQPFLSNGSRLRRTDD